MKEKIRLPKSLEGLKPILLIPFLATLVVGLLMIYVIGTPVKGVMDSLTAWLKSLGTANAVLMGLLLGAMMAFDMGGPVNKAAYTFGVGLLGNEIYGPMAAVMAAGMTPPWACGWPPGLPAGSSPGKSGKPERRRESRAVLHHGGSDSLCGGGSFPRHPLHRRRFRRHRGAGDGARLHPARSARRGLRAADPARGGKSRGLPPGHRGGHGGDGPSRLPAEEKCCGTGGWRWKSMT